MAESEDTEITLGTGKLLAIFFALVGLSALFFGLGFTFGKSSVRSASDAPATTAMASTPRPGSAKPDAHPSSNNLDSYKEIEQKTSDSKLAAKDELASDVPPQSTDRAAATPSNGYFLQVAAVTRQEDAEALIEALKKKQYAAFSASSDSDKLFHVQVGPFADVKEAEVQRAKLMGDGYNPILKR